MYIFESLRIKANIIILYYFVAYWLTTESKTARSGGLPSGA